MKKLFFLALITFVGNLQAATPVRVPVEVPARIEIVSFARVSGNPKDITAEVCGLIHRQQKNTPARVDLIRLILDKDTDTPRVYYTLAGQTGIFCSLVVTIQGTVDASIEGAKMVESIRAKLDS